MKKYLFLFVTAAIVGVSCTKSGLIETPSSQSDPIAFDPYLGKVPVTKAQNSDLTFLQTGITADLTSGGFQVFAFLHGADGTAPTTFSSTYMNEEVWWENAKWEYDKVTYWPEGAQLAFAAFGLNASKGGCLVPKDASALNAYTFEVKDKVSEQVDLIVAPYQTGLTSGNVTLNFKHLLSRVGFKVLSSDAAENVNIAIRSITLHGSFPTTGDVDITKVTDGVPAIENKTGTREDYTLFEGSDCFQIASKDCASEDTAKPIYANMTVSGDTYTAKYTKTDGETDDDLAKKLADAEAKRYMMIMPCTMPAENAYIEVQYQLTSDKVRKAKVDLPSFEFKAGYAYEFILKVSASAIVFDAEMNTDWEPAGTPATPLPLTPEN